MEATTYLTDRVDDQINWYGAKSSLNKKYYRWFQGSIITFAALIPLMSGYLDTFGEGYEFIIGALGAAVAILSGMLGFFKFQEKWINYRTTSEQLKKEKYLYETGTEPYNQAGKSFNLLVKNCEALISGENTEWNNYIRTEDQEE